ncbi:MAG: M48 family metalloprotease [Pseudomonadota bacterium]
MILIRNVLMAGAFCLFLTLAAVIQSAFGITVQEEEELAKEFLEVVKKHYDVIEDPLLVAYVNRIGNRVLAGFLPQPFPYHFNVIRQEVYNAFAGPGGNIYINSGLFAAMDNEEELAGILSHEISHVSSRHISEKIERSGKVQMATLAGVVAGIFLGIGGGGSAASALTIGSMAAGQSAMLAYSRDDEREADKVGLQKLYAAGYTGNGLLTAMKKIRAQQWWGSDEIPSYLTTHPASEERIIYIGNWIASNAPGVQAKPRDDFDFKRMRTRLIALYSDEEQALRQFEAESRDKPGDFLAQYGYALTLARHGNRKDAIPAFKKALELRAFDPYLPTDLGQAYFLDGNYEAALKVLKGADGTVSDAGRSFYIGRIQMEMGQTEAARKTFEQLVADSPGFTEALYYLGEAYGRLEVIDDAHFYLGLYCKEKGDVRKAVFHLERALEKATTSEKKEKIEAELKPLSKKKYKQDKEKAEEEEREREAERQRRREREREEEIQRERQRRS